MKRRTPAPGRHRSTESTLGTWVRTVKTASRARAEDSIAQELERWARYGLDGPSYSPPSGAVNRDRIALLRAQLSG
jgi:hypothetical protein